MSVTVGVDGGQSQIRLRVSGEPDAKSAPGVSHREADTGRAVIDTVAELWNGRSERISRLVAGLTTIPATEGERHLLATRLAEVTGASEVWLGGDEVISHTGAFEGASGVVLSVGTGVACLALDADTGAHRNFDGVGYLVGDEGGGFWLGRHGIRAALAAQEGRGPHTTLAETVAAQLGPLDGVPIGLHSNPRAVDTIAQIAVVVLAEAATGDPVADAIVSDAATRLVTTVSAGVRFLSAEPQVRVALGGRLLMSPREAGGPTPATEGNASRGATLLSERVATGIRAAHPTATISMATGSSLDGACILAEWVAPGPYRPLLTMYRPQP
ncbi:MAG: BadF/BadG/BcrA/BcrD ATPase family protein [Acidimicrobiia bacterium]